MAGIRRGDGYVGFIGWGQKVKQCVLGECVGVEMAVAMEYLG